MMRAGIWASVSARLWSYVGGLAFPFPQARQSIWAPRPYRNAPLEISVISPLRRVIITARCLTLVDSISDCAQAMLAGSRTLIQTRHGPDW
jgi:hypothetical protein